MSDYTMAAGIFERMHKENARLRSEVARLTLKDGQFVAEWGTCVQCGGTGSPQEYEAFGCSRCNGTGRVAVKVDGK